METPKNVKSLQGLRKHTPRLSERKKKLFGNEKLEIDTANDLGVAPLAGIMDETKSRRNIGLELDDCCAEPFNGNENEHDVSAGACAIAGAGADEQLEKLFSDSMDLGTSQRTLRSSSKRQYALSHSPKSPKRSPETKRHRNNSSLCISTRRFYKTSPDSNEKKSGMHNSSKNALMDDNVRKNTKSGVRRSLVHSNVNRGVKHKIRKSAHHHIPPLDLNRILKNVRNERLQNLIRNERETKEQIEVVHSILRNNKDPIAMARPLTAIADVNDNNNNQENTVSSYKESTADFSDIDSDNDNDESLISEVNVTNDQLEVDMEPVIPLINHTTDETQVTPTNVAKRKFFKSGFTTNVTKEIQIMGNIKATIDKGKISLKPDKKVKRSKFKIRSKDFNEFSKEQATVNKILENLDNTTYGDINVTVATTPPQETAELMGEKEPNTDTDNTSSPLSTTTSYDTFRQRLPYKTNDPTTIEQQHLLLDFLISNNICTEENFKIFITDPDNHKDAAARIVDNLVEVVQEQNDDFRARLPYNTSNPDTISQQLKHLDFLIENNICTEETFDIFIANYEERRTDAEDIMNLVTAQSNCLPVEEEETQPVNVMDTIVVNDVDSQENNASSSNANVLSIAESSKENRPEGELFPIFYRGRCQPLIQKSTRNIERSGWTGGEGLNQYQIDAGQKSFGAQQCKQCGLVYTVHEPEEEKLHRDYHASQHIMRFKTWINEDVVAYYPEWGSTDGRIIKLTDSSHIKRIERLREVLKIVDKELGFSSYIIPQIFVAFLAIFRNQIVGLCLVQPLEKANKFVCMNGVDCCTEEEFEAKCGISRIWVSPLHRRIRIASKLLQAVQLNTIVGEEIPFSKIAFSAPTHAGKLFAQKITKTEHFLIYQ